MKAKLEFRILRHEHFARNTVYLGIRLLRFLGRSFAIRIPIRCKSAEGGAGAPREQRRLDASAQTPKEDRLGGSGPPFDSEPRFLMGRPVP